MRTTKRGFTLIELLIVVAIIAILAAIAVPNFLEAQVRSKVSRVKADQRTYATGLEAYFADWNAYPSPIGAQPTLETALVPLSTPVAYLTDALLTEPFNGRQGWILYEGADVFGQGPPADRTSRRTIYLYLGLPDDSIMQLILTPLLQIVQGFFPDLDPQGDANEIIKRRWFVVSPGPDTLYSFDRCLIDFGAGSPITCVIKQIVDMSVPRFGGVYDPTNGTVSQGDICRTAEGVLLAK
jgi:prepilin-type N-terminal cleavage/methylation domain-containing protein